MRRLIVVASALLAAACTSSPSDSAPPLVPTTTTAASVPAVTTTQGSPASRPTGPVDKACALLTVPELEHAFGPTALKPVEQPPKGLGVAYRHGCQYSNPSVTISLDVLFARDQGGTERKAIQDATKHRKDVEMVPGVGSAAAYFRMETGSTSGFAAAKPMGTDSVMVILLAKAADHAGSKETFAQLCTLALERIK